MTAQIVNSAPRRKIRLSPMNEGISELADLELAAMQLRLSLSLTYGLTPYMLDVQTQLRQPKLRGAPGVARRDRADG
jgi:hypothetical protein